MIVDEAVRASNSSSGRTGVEPMKRRFAWAKQASNNHAQRGNYMRTVAVIATVELLLISSSLGMSHAASPSNPSYKVVELEFPTLAELSPVGQSEAKQFPSQLLAQQGPQVTSPPKQQVQKSSGVSCSNPTTAEAAMRETLLARESALKAIQASESRGGLCAALARGTFGPLVERADASLNNLLNQNKGRGGPTAGMWYGYCGQYATAANLIKPECR